MNLLMQGALPDRVLPDTHLVHRLRFVVASVEEHVLRVQILECQQGEDDLGREAPSAR